MTVLRLAVLSIAIALSACSTAPRSVPATPENIPPSAGLSGNWLLTVESPMGRDEVETTFEQSGHRLGGFMKSAGTNVPIEGTLEGKSVNFGMSLEVRGQPLKFDYVGTVEGDTMSGTVQFGPMGTGKFSGVRKLGN